MQLNRFYYTLRNNCNLKNDWAENEFGKFVQTIPADSRDRKHGLRITRPNENFMNNWLFVYTVE